MKDILKLVVGFALLILAIQHQFPQELRIVPKTDVPAPTELIPGPDEPVVARVIDGDTIVVLVNSVSEKVRLIGVDTPEVLDPRKPVQCFGVEASEFTKTIATGAVVSLEADSSQDNRDKFGRLLRYVYLPDGTMLNKKIIAEGYGHEYTYRIPYKYQEEFKAAETSARESQKGLWAAGACGLQNTQK